ncbi:helix-turn-helix domain-containing protein [bacterium]|nr:helix-turn-helix domain-containing protein [bacterium]
MRSAIKNKQERSVASAVREAISQSTDRVWVYTDFNGMPPAAVSQALSRLYREGLVKRVRKGVYYRPKQTVLGESKVSPAALISKLLPSDARPTGYTAARVLGLSTQVPVEPSYAVSKSKAPASVAGVKVTVRRPVSSICIDTREAAILEFLRERGTTSERSPEETVRRLLHIIKEPGVFAKLAEAAMQEPPRVRAMLGALGQEARIRKPELVTLRSSLNPLSRYDFGRLRCMRYAKEWLAK